MYYKRSINHPAKRHTALRLAAEQGVSVERFLEVVAARKAYRKARFYRQRSRRRTLLRNPKAQRKQLLDGRVQYAGEGELHPLMREAGFKTNEEFCKFAGIYIATFKEWYGHPLHRMPIALLEHFIWARNMAAFLAERGWDPEKFKAKGLPPAPAGRYPRTTEQGRALLEDEVEK